MTYSSCVGYIAIVAKKTPGSKKRQLLTREKWLERMSYGQRQRLRFFESKLLWEGRVTRGDVHAQFGVTKNHFSREVSEYRRFFASNFEYDAWIRGYRPKATFRPAFATGQPEEYLALLRLCAVMPSAPIVAELGALVPTAIPEEPTSKIDQKTLAAILRAIHGAGGVAIRYQSFSQDTPSSRTVWPRALIWSGERWYVRVFDSQRHAYISLALQRILASTASTEALPKEAGTDTEWENTEWVEVIPNPALPEMQRRAVAHEYGMAEDKSGYVWRVRLRQCLVSYFLNRYRLDDLGPPKTRGKVPAQRIVVRDPEIVKKYAFPGD